MTRLLPAAPYDPAKAEKILFAMTGALAFDIGANQGRTATQLAGSFDRVVSFEPAEESYQALVAAAFSHPNITTVQIAVTALDGPVALNVQEYPIKSGQLTSNAPGAYDGWGRIIEHRVVIGRTLDSLAADYGVPDLVKVDVEGHETHVILGGLRTLVEHTPELYIEIHSAELGWRVEQILRPAYGERLRLVRHPGYMAGSWGHINHYYLIAEEPNSD